MTQTGKGFADSESPLVARQLWSGCWTGPYLGGRLFSSALAKLRTTAFGIASDETTFRNRGFQPGRPEAQAKLENIGGAFVSGYHAALQSNNTQELILSLNLVDLEFSGFAFEGAAMALTLLDHLTPWHQSRFSGFLAGPGERHAYMLHIGAGWAHARLPWLRYQTNPPAGPLDPLLRWLAVDGFGFHEGYFAWARVGEKQLIPRGIRGYARRCFDHGLGRSVWFVNCADATRVAETIACFDRSRRADLWSGIGLASTYAGAYTERDLAEVCSAAGGYRAELAQGAAFAAKARLRAGNLGSHTERACEIICGTSAREAAGVTDAALKNLPQDGPEPAFEVWRQRIQREFATVRR
jgi:hypothetical protein